MKSLVLSGGADHGAYQVGALKYLIKQKQHDYDIMCGISVGALNVAFLAQFKDLNEGIDELEKMWINIRKKDIYKRWFPFGELHALWKRSVYNSQPIIDLVYEKIDLDKIRKNGRKIGVGAVCLETGQYRIFTQNEDCFLDGVLASSSFPIAFKPIKIDNLWWSDGGIKHITPIKDAIEMGSLDMDLIVTNRFDLNKADNKKNKRTGSTLPIAMQAISLMRDEIEDADVKMLKLYNELAKDHIYKDKKFINVNFIHPIKGIPGSSLDFKHSDIMKSLEIGYENAVKLDGKKF